MRKTGLFLLFITTVVLSACQKTDTPPGGNPISITVSPMTTTAKAGDSVVFNVNISDNNTLKDVVVSQSLGGGTESQLASYSLTGKTYSFTYAYHVPSGFTGDIKIKFLVDDASNTNSATATITVGTSGSDVNTYSAVLLGNYNDSHGSFFSSTNGSVYNVSTANANQGLIDMIFFYGSTNQATLAAPNDGSFGTGSGQISSLGVQNWSTRNATTFKSTTLSSISTVTSSAAIASAYAAGTDYSPNSRANMLNVNKVIAFKTAAGKLGLVQVTALSADATGAGTMTINVVVQK
jgi:hypothetical protein